MPPIQINGVSYDGEHAIRARVAELDAEHAGQPMSGAAREEWNELNAVVDERVREG
jgi:hypothetical protein